MTEKRVIIHGIDVTDCKRIMAAGFSFPQCRDELHGFSPACCQHEDCAYKNWKRADKLLLKVLRNVKDKYYKDEPTYFDYDLERLEKEYGKDETI